MRGGELKLDLISSKLTWSAIILWAVQIISCNQCLWQLKRSRNIKSFNQCQIVESEWLMGETHQLHKYENRIEFVCRWWDEMRCFLDDDRYDHDDNNKCHARDDDLFWRYERCQLIQTKPMNLDSMSHVQRLRQDWGYWYC